MAFCVFGVTGSSSVAVVRPCLNSMGLEGNMRDGPWNYRIISLVAVSPIYACMLVTFGTLAGRHRFFKEMAGKIVGRMMPASVRNRIFAPPTVRAVTTTTTTTTKETVKEAAKKVADSQKLT